MSFFSVCATERRHSDETSTSHSVSPVNDKEKVDISKSDSDDSSDSEYLVPKKQCKPSKRLNCSHLL